MTRTNPDSLVKGHNCGWLEMDTPFGSERMVNRSIVLVQRWVYSKNFFISPDGIMLATDLKGKTVSEKLEQLLTK